MTQWSALRANMTSSVGFVPTMGALHEGHLSLLRASAAANSQTVLSIYVNATQFNDPQDFAKYPNTLEADLAKARSAGVDVVLLPDFEQMYSDGFRFQLNEIEFASRLCGTDRPGHFTGVLTVVMKLLNLVRPNRAYFGLKDFQQYMLIKDMCETFFVPTEIVGCPIVREADGLAMSSRNALLDVPARSLAGRFNSLLANAANDAQAVQALRAAGMSVAYVETVGTRRCAAVVIRSGDCAVRLIDNVAVPGSLLPTELKDAVA
ncbi:MAG: pantoate--beta-alanine ligase [Proteobacteria bacterium]|nr:pantoate--beta-alanine ligase [Pseudomonadota bacterium]